MKLQRFLFCRVIEIIISSFPLLTKLMEFIAGNSLSHVHKYNSIVCFPS